MSGSLNNIYNNVGFALSLHSQEIFRLQEQVSSGSRINRASDAPSDAYRVLSLTSQKVSTANYIDNLMEVMDTLEFATIAIDDIKGALSDAKSLLGGVTGGATEGAGLTVTMEGINDVLEKIVAAANTTQSGKYIFGGTNTSSAPYVVTRVDGQITAVTYQGSFEYRNIEVAPSVSASALQVGDDIFRSDNRSEPLFTGQTGAAAGTGTSSVQGDVWLTVTGTAGNYDLSIDGGLSTVNTDGTDTNLAVTDSRTGRVLYVDTTGISSTGTEWVCVPGTYNIFDTLITIRDRLATEGGLSSAEMEELRYNAFTAIDEVNTVLVQKSVSVGSKIGFLENIKHSLENVKYDSEDETARIEQADIAQLAIDLSRREILYQMSLAMAGKILSMSLLDFM